MRIGILSDTHGYLDAKVEHFFKDCDEIWHCGDIGGDVVVEQLKKRFLLRAVYGNIDGAELRRQFSEMLLFSCNGVKVLMTHIGGYPRHYSPQALAKIQSSHPKIFISGHSHILRVEYDKIYDLLHINPGAAGCYGFHKVRTALRFTIDGETIKDMELGEWPRTGHR